MGRVYRGRQKYGNTIVEYGGRKYHSKREAAYAASLDMRVAAGQILEWKAQHRVRLEVAGEKICDYIIDFQVSHIDGTIEYVEVKGFETPDWKLKMKLFKALYPDAIYTIVK